MQKTDKKPKSEEKQEKAPPSSLDVLGSILTETKEEHFNNVVAQNQVISTGSLILDSLVRIRTGSMVRLCGSGSELGKSSEAAVLAANFMSTVEKSKTIWIKAESRLSPEFQTRTGLKFVTKPEDWVDGTVFVWSVNIFEVIAGSLEKMLKTMHDLGEKLCVVWDSLDGTILRGDAEKDVWGTKGDSAEVMVAGVPKLTKLLFRRLGLPVAHYDALMIITSQHSTAISISKYAKDVPRQVEASGGSNIAHQADYVFYYTPRYQGDYILEQPEAKPDPIKNKVLGVYATIEIKKSGTDVTGTKVKIPIKKGRVGCSIWSEKEACDLILSFQLVTVKASWLLFDAQIIEEAAKQGITLKEKIQGINQLYDYLESDKAILNFFLAKIKAAIS